MNRIPNDPRMEDEQLEAQLGLLRHAAVRAMNQIILNQEDAQRRLDGLDDAGLPLLRQALSDAGVARNSLERTLDDLFRAQELRLGRAEARLEPVELCGLLRDICADRETIQRELGVRVTLDCGGTHELYAAADRDWLVYICLQLFSNALRACKAGGQVELRLCPGAQEHLLWVLDDGCGLPEQAARGENREHFVGGTGAGLLLCQSYCRRLGWTLKVGPRPEGGTAAAVHIPAQETAPLVDRQVHLRSAVWEEMQQRQQLHDAVCRELHAVPGLETAALGR